jgi:hypothetical protein
MVGQNAVAYDCEVDGIYYNLSENTAMVTMGYFNEADYEDTYDFNDRYVGSYSGNITIPASFVYNGQTYSVTGIEISAFSRCTNLNSVVISEGVTTINMWAFADCDVLKSIVIPASVTSINGTPFIRCKSLESIKVAEGNPIYDSRNDCNAIIRTSDNALIAGCINTVIPDGVMTIADGAFMGSGIVSIHIPASVTQIERNIFNYCEKLANITVDEGNTVYDSRGNCNAIIWNNQIYLGCKNTSIPESIKTIGRDAFYLCWGLTDLFIPAHVTQLNNRAYGGCKNLKSIKVAEGNTNYDSRNECNALISKSDNRLEYGCVNTVIPETVTSLSGNSFWLMPITSIDIPSSVKEIRASAFNGCKYLRDVIYRAEELPTSNSVQNIFEQVLAKKAVLHVPVSAIETYRTTEPWSWFKMIVGIGSNEESALNVAEIDGPSVYEDYYDLKGCRMSTPKRGLNIVKQRDGKVIKVMRQ